MGWKVEGPGTQRDSRSFLQSGDYYWLVPGTRPRPWIFSVWCHDNSRFLDGAKAWCFGSAVNAARDADHYRGGHLRGAQDFAYKHDRIAPDFHPWRSNRWDSSIYQRLGTHAMVQYQWGYRYASICLVLLDCRTGSIGNPLYLVFRRNFEEQID